MKSVLRVVLALACVASMVALGGCDAVVERATGEAVDGFAKDVPVYDGTIVDSVRSGEGSMLKIQTSDDARTVYAWYIETAGSAGWKNVMKYEMSDGGIVSAEKDGRVFHATITSTDQGTDIGLSIAPKR